MARVLSFDKKTTRGLALWLNDRLNGLHIGLKMVSNLRLFAAILSAFVVAGCAADAESAADRGEYLFNNNCTVCHGYDAGGKAHLAVPSLAGLGDWYVKAQLQKFQAGIRGTHPEDMPGMRMRPMSRTLESEADIDKVADYIRYLRPVKGDVTATGGNVENGKALYVTCAACHGPDGAGMQALNAPAIRQMDDWYMLTQLYNFKNGLRGADPRDITGAQMAPMAQALAGEQAMKDVVAYIKTFEN
jgi:cytochrome c553